MAGIFNHPDCTAAHLVQAGQPVDLTVPLQDNGVTLFRSTLYVRVPLDPRCQRLVLASGSKLLVRFEPAIVQITRGSDAWLKQWDEETGQVTVELTYPAPIVKVHSDLYGRVKLFRMDGGAVSPAETVAADTGHALPQPFVGPAFRAVFDGLRQDAFQRGVANRVLQQQMGTFQSLSAAAVHDDVVMAIGDPDYALANTRFMMEFALDQLDVAGNPATPRLRLLSTSQSESLWQWLEAGEHSSTVTFSAEGADLAKQLQPALDRALALRQPADTALVLPLMVESDAPCQVVLQQATLEFLLEAELMSTPAQLSFAGGSEQTQLVPLDAPAQAVRLHLEATVASHDGRNAGEPPALPDDARRTGIRMDEGTEAAALWEADTAAWLIGFALAWYPMSERATLHLSLRAEAAGPGAGATLAEGRVDTAPAEAAWLRCLWPQTAMQPGRYWLRVQVEKGSGLWLGETAEGPRPLWQRTPPAPGATTNVPLQPLHFPLEAAEPDAVTAPPVRLALNDTTLTLSSPRDGALTADVDATAALAGATPWNLAASSASDLSITVRSARVTYRA